jgi:cardiolipin synthase
VCKTLGKNIEWKIRNRVPSRGNESPLYRSSLRVEHRDCLFDRQVIQCPPFSIRLYHTDNGDKYKRIAKEGKTEDEKKKSFFSSQTRDQIIAIWTQSQNIPNLITIARIASTPVLCHLILTDQFQYALVGCVLAGLSDGLDGYIARKYNQITVLGTYLDPLADKIFINSIAISLGVAEIIPLWCSALWLGRDVLLVGMAYRTAAVASRGKGYNVVDPSRTPLKIEPSMISRVNTVLQFGSIWGGVSMAAFGDISTLGQISLGTLSFTPIEGICYVASGTTVLSGLGYLDGSAMTKSDNK